VSHRPLMAVPPLVLGGGMWLIRHQTPMLDPGTEPAGGAKLGIGVGALLAILCQSQGGLALPSAIMLGSILLAATRSHPLMQIVALVGAQNGLALAECLAADPASPAASLLPSLACLVLPLPIAAGLLAPTFVSGPSDGPLSLGWSWRYEVRRGATWLGWVDLGAALAIFAATLLVPLDSLASVFAPLLGLDGVLRSCARRNRDACRLRARNTGLSDAGLGTVAVETAADPLSLPFNEDSASASSDEPSPAMPIPSSHAVTETTAAPRSAGPIRRASALAQTGCTVLAVCAPNLIVAWLAVLAAMTMALLPTLLRHWGSAVLAFLAAGLALFGILLLSAATPPVIGYFSLFVGFVAMAAIVPDLAVVLVILILRLANEAPWPKGVEALGIGIAVVALLGCAILLTNPVRSHRTTLLVLSQTSLAALTVCVGEAEGRFAALVLLILLILTRAAARITDGPAAALSIAGLGGISPLGVFPGLVLVALAVSAHAPWLLLPLGLALIPIVSASIPRRLSHFPPWRELASVAWLPLLLAVLVGYFAPDGLVHWWRILTAGRT
jgi:hypothetical protein